jgi:UDP-N-acetylmuramate dehydrogenase
MTDARDPRLAAAMRERVRGRVVEAEPLARLCSYRIGGPATVFHPADPEDLAVGLGQAARLELPVFALGLGSNVLLPDEGMSALVVRLGKGLDRWRADQEIWRLGAGMPAPMAARRTAEAGWSGLQMMVGVPGTVGGGVYMNAGCHGGQWADVVRRVWVVDRTGTVEELSREAIPFRYRRSGLGDRLVTEVEVALTPGDPAELALEVRRLLTWRQERTPFNQPCCGSVFKNPEWVGDPPGPDLRTAGQLIEATGLKGHRVGGAEVSPMHANYFVNTGSGSAEDVRRLMAEVQGVVRQRFGVGLDPEVKVIGPAGDWLKEGATDG